MQQLPPQEVYSQGNGPWLPQESPPFDYYKRPRPSMAQIYPDDSDRRASLISADGRPKPDYRPVSLRWWFISILIAVFVAIIGLVLYGNSVLRNSDTTAKIDERSIGHDEAWEMYKENMVKARQVSSDGIGSTQVDGAGSTPAGTIPTIPIPSNTQDTAPGNVLGTTAPVPPPTDLGSGGDAGGRASPTPTTQDGQDATTNTPDGAQTRPTDEAAAPDELPDGMRLTAGLLDVSTLITITAPPETTVIQVTSKETKNIIITETIVTTLPAEPGKPEPTRHPIVPEPEEPPPPPPPEVVTIPGKTTQMFVPVPIGNSTSTRTTMVVGSDVVTTIYPTNEPTQSNAQPPQPSSEDAAPTSGSGGGGGGGIGQVVTSYKTITTQTVEQKTMLSTTVKPGNVYATPGTTRIYTSWTVDSAGEIVRGPVTMVQTKEVEGKVITYVDTPEAKTQVETAFAGMLITHGASVTRGQVVTSVGAAVAGQLVTQVAVAKAGEVVSQIAVASEGQVVTQVTAGADGQLVTQLLTASAGQFFTVVSTATGGELVTQVAAASAGQIITAVSTASEDGIINEIETASEGQLITRISSQAAVTRVTSIPPTRAVITSVTTPTGGAGAKIVVESRDYSLTPLGYFIGKFLPPIVAVIIALAIRAVDQTAKLYQPFAALSHPQGATGRNSLSLHFDGWSGFWRPFSLLREGHAAPFLTTLAVGGSALLAPLASGAVGLKIHGHCSNSSIQGCALSLGITTSAAFALVALCGVIAILLIALIFVVSRRWKTGVFADPWCVAGTAALVRNPDVRHLGLLDWRTLKTTVAKKQFALGWFRNAAGREEYGIVMYDESGQSLRRPGADTFPQHMPEDEKRKPHTTFAALTFWWRIAFMAYLTVLLSLVLYYHVTDQLTDTKGNFSPDTFKKLLGKQRFVTRFIASGLGVVVIFCWECVWTSIATIAPYQRMARGLQSAERSVLSRRPVYAVTGLYWGLKERDPLFFLTALMAVLAQLLPITLANVPYDLTQTQLANSMCSRISAGLLAIMITFLFGLLFISFPPLPVDPRSVAGAMWYIAESRWVDHLEGLTLMTGKERERRMEELGGRWYYGVADSRVGGHMAVEMQEVYRSVEYGRY